jgi:endoglucanase
MWSGVTDLVQTVPLREPNTVYTLHFYESNLFTMQGSPWDGWDVLEALHGVPYPSTPQLVAPLLPGLPANVRTELRRYGEERWNADRIATRLDLVDRWAKQHDVAWFVGEFGVRKTDAPGSALTAWIRDVRLKLAELGIGWTYWGYLDEFGVMDGWPDDPDHRTLNAAVAEGLGL